MTTLFSDGQLKNPVEFNQWDGDFEVSPILCAIQGHAIFHSCVHQNKDKMICHYLDHHAMNLQFQN